MRTTRVWFCPCCRSAMRRHKDDFRGFRCPICSEESISGFGWKETRRCLHVRNRTVIARFDSKMGSRVRTQSQRVYRPSPTTKAIWREIRAAKTRPAIERRAQTWLDAVLSDTRDAGDERWTKTMYVNKFTGRATVQKHRSTYSSTPIVERVPLTGGLMGDFRRSLLRGHYGVRLADRLGPDELRRTLVHEALHVLDSEADINDHDHNALWRKRLVEMERHFPPTGRGRL